MSNILKKVLSPQVLGQDRSHNGHFLRLFFVVSVPAVAPKPLTPSDPWFWLASTGLQPDLGDGSWCLCIATLFHFADSGDKPFYNDELFVNARL